MTPNKNNNSKLLSPFHLNVTLKPSLTFESDIAKVDAGLNLFRLGIDLRNKNAKDVDIHQRCREFVKTVRMVPVRQF